MWQDIGEKRETAYLQQVLWPEPAAASQIRRVDDRGRLSEAGYHWKALRPRMWGLLQGLRHWAIPGGIALAVVGILTREFIPILVGLAGVGLGYAALKAHKIQDVQQMICVFFRNGPVLLNNYGDGFIKDDVAIPASYGVDDIEAIEVEQVAALKPSEPDVVKLQYAQYRNFGVVFYLSDGSSRLICEKMTRDQAAMVVRQLSLARDALRTASPPETPRQW